MFPSPFARVAVLSLFLAACAAPHVREASPPGAAVPAAPVAAAPAVPATPPVPAIGTLADDDLNAVAWQQTALEYRLVAMQTFRSATAQLDRALRDKKWDALATDERDRPARGLPPAVIVDVDETMLDNSPYQVRLIREHRSFDEVTWAQWVREAAAKAVPGALDFAKAAARRGITVYYVSNRSADLSGATFDNLRSAGFPIADPSQFLGLGTLLPGCEQIGTEKGCRRRLVGRSHRVLLQLGDQIGDMVSVVANTPAGRDAAMAPYLDWIATRWFVLPNPSYGSWEPALFNNDWSQPASERRRQKIEALHWK
jgi:acid phosphatase